MKKKIAGLLLCAAVALQGISVPADTKDVSVLVDNRNVYFSDQAPIIESDRVLVPLRGVFEAMGASVEWNGDERSVTINTYDNRIRLILTIDNQDMTRIYFTTVKDTDITTVNLDVAPTIVNDRTMIPLRAISDSMNSIVNWDPDTYTVKILSSRMMKAYNDIAESNPDDIKEGNINSEYMIDTVNATLPKLSLSSDSSDAKVGDTVKVKVNLSNSSAYQSNSLVGGILTIYYDSDKYTYNGYAA